MIIQDTQKDFKIAPVGNHIARLYSIIDLGHQAIQWAGATKIMHKVEFIWELHGDDDAGQPLKTDNGKPLIASKRYTVSLGDQARLRQDLEAWSGKKMTAEDRKNFDLKGLLGKFCMVNITHSEDGKFANISGISPVPSALRSAQPEGINPTKMFWLQEFRQDEYDALPKYYKEKIAESSEWRGQKQREAAKPAVNDNPMPDDIPF